MLNRTSIPLQQPDRVRATVDAIRALRMSDALPVSASALQVEVSVAEGLRANPNDTVFVVARPVGGDALCSGATPQLVAAFCCSAR